MTNYLHYDTSGNITGVGSTIDGTIPANAIECTAAEAQEWQGYSVDTSTTPPSIVPLPSGALLQQAKSAQVAVLKQSMIQSLATLPISIGGTSYLLDNGPISQSANLAASMTASAALQAPAWSASTPVTVNTTCMVSGSVLFCSTEGTTGTTAPTPPAFGSSVTDGTAVWELFGRHFDLSPSGTVLLTAQQILEAFTQVEAYVHAQKTTLANLYAQINAATSVSSVKAIVWA